MMGGLIIAVLLTEYIPLLGVICGITAILYAIKMYYVVLMVKDWISERKKR